MPLHFSAVPPDVDLTPFYVGARMLRLTNVAPQQLQEAGLLLAEEGGRPLYPEVAVTMPRRAAKTTTIWAVLLGLCAMRPGFKVVTTAQSGIKARERFLEVARILMPNNVGEFRVLRGAAAEAVEWTNGSRLWVVPPDGGAFRGDAADRILFDEGQEHSVLTTQDLLGGALALMDTRYSGDVPEGRPEGQVIVAGTAGKLRAGMLWDYLESGRRGELGILEYAVPDGVPVVVDGELNVPAILGAHPGIGTLTTLDAIRDRYGRLPVHQFQREYAGQWPFDASTRAIDPELWAAGARPAPDGYPLKYALAYDVAPDQSSAALAAAWRTEDGTAWVETIDHRDGDGWLPAAVYARTREHRTVPVGYDRIGPNRAVADRLEREAKPRPKLVDLGTVEITAAASQVMADLVSGTLCHVSDPSLDAAAEVATRRSIGDGSWAWGRRQGKRDGGDIAPLVAATNALRTYDKLLARGAHRAPARMITRSA